MFVQFMSLVDGGTDESSKIESRLSRLKSSYSKSFIPPLSIIPESTSRGVGTNLISCFVLEFATPHFFPSYVDSAEDNDEVIIAFNLSNNELFIFHDGIFFIGFVFYSHVASQVYIKN